MRRTENLNLPIYDNPESDIFKVSDVNNAHETIDKQYKELKLIKETVESTNPSANLQGQINDINSSLDNITHKTIRINSCEKQAPESNDNGRLQRAINNLEENGVLIIDENLNLSVSINLKSNISIFNRGNVINIENTQNYQVFSGVGLSNVFIDGLNITSNTVETDNQANAGIYFTCGDNECKNITIQNCNLDSTKWGILINADRGNGSFDNVKILHNKVTNSKDLTVHDGIHLVGRINNSIIQGNYVNNRHDAGIALNMTGGYVGKNNLVIGNISIDNLVGIDFSGTQYSKAVNNICISNKEYKGSNPAIRIIEFLGSIPYGNIIENNILSNNNTLSSEYCFKIDIGNIKTDTNSIVRNNKFLNGGIYLKATNVLISSNIFEGDSYIRLDNYCYNITIEPNTFKKSYKINGSANKGLTDSVVIYKQNGNGLIDDFYKNYTNDLWLTQNYRYISSKLEVFKGLFTTTSSAYVDVPNCLFSIEKDILITGVNTVHSLETHNGNVVITDLSNNIVATINMDTTPGTGLTDTNKSYLSNGYAIKLPKGVYKIRAKSQLNTFSLKYLSLNYI